MEERNTPTIKAGTASHVESRAADLRPAEGLVTTVFMNMGERMLALLIYSTPKQAGNRKSSSDT
ncbi:hypothetical protein EYF80_055030 [Liparis tanakae]|uniref:Uncharacterized protein n=1 Tax=Liparis tanakae TaxID=230148 RepID=A0A4Z2F1G4_9TELE|nr:hypothetical protein EYF80_055030 [Liparis tanakae]